MEMACPGYYEQPALWSRDFASIPAQNERIEKTVQAIPADARSVLDVGCGNGFFLGYLASKKACRFDKLVGIDPSNEARRHASVKTVEGSAIHLPFDSESFDLVTCLEVLEHVPYPDYDKAISELERVSRRYVLITVPNNQNLFALLVRCPKCHCFFNRHLHVRSYERETLAGLFREFKMVYCEEIGPVKQIARPNRLLRFIYLYRKRASLPALAVCPQCGHSGPTGTAAPEWHSGQRSRDARNAALARRVSRVFSRYEKKRPWLLALYEKEVPCSRKLRTTRA